jgi:hypothetical protein
MNLLKEYRIPMILSLLFNVALIYHYSEIPTLLFIVCELLVNAVWVGLLIEYIRSK